MSPRDWFLRLEDILGAIQKIKCYTAGMNIAAWRKDSKTIDAVIRNLEVIGEAASHIPLEIQDLHPDIPWQQLRGIRNILIHEYFGVDEDVIWETVQTDLEVLEKILKPLTGP